ncbi:protein suppressor of underreplication [Drosophila busckii]|uniref:protein suppressor of underreplication n=1 Tax=Drosophila busckii TaxID=30019 RepID=UPI001432B7B7|nr:protein suppressor of underreplication [Drosophila busckii]
MYHFVAEQTPELRLARNVLVGSQTTQYLKSFQLEAVRFLYDRLSKQDFCIYNDESGLGKCASVVALLGAIGACKKTLIVTQNDDHLLAGWQFHLGVLTDLSVCLIKDIKDSTASPHSVYLAKWSVLRGLGDLRQLKFDYIIVDHRGHMLNNNFCTSMLLKRYERKINIVISSVDITSDIKLLYNVLRLGGRLEHQYNSFRSFERKFNLPDVKDVLSKRVDLEVYYKQRGIIGEYIKNFRLRRYRHQFEAYLPLVSVEQYTTNLSNWLGENNSNSTISGSTIASTTSTRSTGDTDEIFECLMSIKKEHEAAKLEQIDNISISDCSEEVVAMEPLVFEMSEPETEADAASKSSTEVVLVSSEDCDIVTPPITPPLLAALTKPEATIKPKTKCAKRVKNIEAQPRESSRSTRNCNVRLTRLNLAADTLKISARKTDKQVQNPQEPKDGKAKTQAITPKTEPRSNRGENIGRRETRSMQRLTRSAEATISNKYINTTMALDFEKTPKSSRKSRHPIKKTANKPESTEKMVKPNKIVTKKIEKENLESVPDATPQLLSASSFSSDSYMQCAQKLPENLSDMAPLPTPEFRVPSIPQSPLLLHTSTNLFNDSELIMLPSLEPPSDVVVINSSIDESQPQSQQSTKQLPSRRTRALKRKPKAKTSPIKQPSTSSFGLLLAEQRRSANKSPDIFSNCSDMSQMSLAQPLPSASPFEGFKIFGSEVKHLQQQHAQATPPKKKRERSCLDLLEQMFEPPNKKPSMNMVLPSLPSPKKKLPQRRFTLLDEDIFEITNNGEFGNRLRLNANGNVSPVHYQQTQQPQPQRNKITNYLISSGNTPEEAHSTRLQASPAQRKSPKALKSTQSTKLTRWFGSVTQSQSVPNTPIVPAEKQASARAARSGGATKRKRLDLNK